MRSCRPTLLERVDEDRAHLDDLRILSDNICDIDRDGFRSLWLTYYDEEDLMIIIYDALHWLMMDSCQLRSEELL